MDLTVLLVNDAPVLSAPIADQEVDEDTPWSFQVSVGSFTDVDTANLTYSAALADGSALPAWVAFDGNTQTFSGVPLQDFNGVIGFMVMASDGAFGTSDAFDLAVRPVP